MPIKYDVNTPNQTNNINNDVTQTQKMHQSLVIVGLSALVTQNTHTNIASATRNVITCECSFICSTFLFDYCNVVGILSTKQRTKIIISKLV